MDILLDVLGSLFASILSLSIIAFFVLGTENNDSNKNEDSELKSSRKDKTDTPFSYPTTCLEQKNEKKSHTESSIESSSVDVNKHNRYKEFEFVYPPTITGTLSYTTLSAPSQIENGTTYYYWIIKNTTPKRFSSIREYAANQINGGSIPLPGRGVYPLSTERELNQYIFSYGNMHYAKLKSALNYLPASLFQEALDIIDWGCGQGIATITLLELKRPKNAKFTLIEPGLLALKRAALNTKCFFEAYTSGGFNCKTINKGFDNLTRSDVATSPNRTKIHLFSNTLDIEGRYSQTELINLIKNTQSGKNYFVCCSPYINFEKRKKIDNFVNSFRWMSNFRLYCSVDNSMDDEWWECNRHFKGYNLCSYKDCEDCNEKWTRIIRVFSVNL